jgi:hypothetical protein
MSLWFGVLQSTFPVKLFVPAQSQYHSAPDCGTFFHTGSARRTCAGPLQFRRGQVLVAVLVGVAAITIALWVGRALLRSVKWGLPLLYRIAVVVGVVVALLAVVGMFAVDRHYSRYGYGDSAWTDALEWNTFHRRVWYDGFLFLLFGVGAAIIGAYLAHEDR